MSDTIMHPIRLGLRARAPYPERLQRTPNWLELGWGAISAIAVTRSARLRAWWLQRIVRKVERFAAKHSHFSDAELLQEARELRIALRSHGLDDILLVGRAFSLVREVATRQLDMRHFDVQLIGGYALLKGMLAEMGTGEGKTLTATLACATAALAGISVHVVTVNDYLAKRDSDWMRPIYEALDISVGLVVHGQSPDERRAAYRADVTYATNKEIVFDYLRDRIALGGQVGENTLRIQRLMGADTPAGKLLLRGLHFAIVDEADSILVDEARTPLVVSGETDADERIAMGQQALLLSQKLEEQRDFVIRRAERRIELTGGGCRRIAGLVAEEEHELWHNEVLREELLRQALAARYLFYEGEDYIVRGGKVQIVDEFTGRIMSDRSWSEGLHQLIEQKEGLEPSRPRVPVARITYQRFFRRYTRLAGMTGTAREVAGELWSVFRLPVVAVSPNRPTRRKRRPDHVHPNADAKWRHIARRCAELHAKGCPVLIGTRSVAASEVASSYLSMAKLPHRVLSATQDQQEAEIIREAGQLGNITVATNMAGRGTDIKLGAGVIARGGLHVIMTERHEAGRIDRQLAGRCARQGEPGSFEAILALDDPIVAHFPRIVERLPIAGSFGAALAGLFIRYAQRKAERSHARMRRRLLRHDERLGDMLAFSGKLE